MTPEDASVAYVGAAALHGAATSEGDHDKANAAHDTLIEALLTLRESPDRGRSTLTALLDLEDASVRCWAATHLLPIDERAATQALAALVSEPPFVGFDAKMILREWKAGRFEVP